ncbi:MAG: STAS domain-containing protein [Bdellovibrionota bacterium]
MKLSLRQEDGVSILEVAGAVDLQNFQILKAGISKLLRDGKNRIVLKVNDADQIPSDVLRELAIVDVFARELSGKIVLASENEKLKESVRAFAKPPVIPILSTVALCLEYFKTLANDEEEGGATSAEIKKALEGKDREIAALEARIKLLDPKELQKVQAQRAELQTKVTLLEGQVAEFMKAQRDPGDVAGFLEKITFLEDNVKKLAGASAEAAPKKG